MSEPLREETTHHQCRCVIRYRDDRDDSMSGEMLCAVVVESSDVPFCGSCEDRHPDASVMYSPYMIEVTAW